MDVNSEKPAAENKPLRIWKTWEVIAAISTVVLTFSFLGALVAPRPNAPSDRNGRKYVVFQEIVQRKEIRNEQREIDSISTREKISANVVAQYKDGDPAMAAAVGQARVKLKKLQARNDSITKMYKARNDSIAKSYKQIYARRNDSIAKLEMAKNKMKPKNAVAKPQVRIPQKN